MRRSTWILLILLLATRARAAEQVWTLTTGDFQSQAVRLLAMDQRGARVVPATGGDEQFIPVNRFLELSRAIASGPQDNDGLIIEIAGGDRLAGRPVGMSSENLIWQHAALGDIALALRRLRDLRRADDSSHAPAIDPQTPATEDAVWLTNGDSVRGILTDLDAEALSIRPAGATDAVKIEMQSVARISFAAVGADADDASEAQPVFRVRLADGSAITVRSAQIAGEDVALVLAESDQEPRSLALAQVVAIEQINGPVTWLSSLTPVDSVHTPVFQTPWPVARMDQAVGGGAIRFGSRTYAHGIGVHSYSRLKYQLSGVASHAYAAFRTQYAIDGNRPHADVTVRIKLDGDRVVHEQKEFRAGKLSPVIVVDLAGAKTLTLEVDYGQSYDVQDRFNWIEPALLRQRPAPETPISTRPAP